MRNINIAKPVAPRQPYGYYSPLMGLEEKAPKASKAKPVKSAIVDVQSDFNVSSLSSSGKKSGFSTSSALKLAIASISVLTLGVIFAGMYAQNSAQSAGDDGFCGLDDAPLANHSFVNQTLGQQPLSAANPNPVFELLSHNANAVVQATATGVAAFSESAMGVVSSTFEAGVALFEAGVALVNGAQTAVVDNYYDIKKLEEVTISEADQQVLNIREKHPTYFKSSFVRRLLGSESAIGKAITLGAALGETSKPISQIYSLNRRCAGKCSLDTIQDIRGNPKGNPMSKEDFVERQEMFGGYTEGEYEAYLGEFKAAQANIDKVIGRVDPKIFAELEAAHKAQVASAPDLVNSKFMHFPERPVEGNFSEVGNYLGDAAAWNRRGSISSEMNMEIQQKLMKLESYMMSMKVLEKMSKVL